MTKLTETPVDVGVLKAAMDAAHATYSDRHAETEAAERKLQEVATRLGTLDKRRKALAHGAEKLKNDLAAALIVDPAIKIDVTALTLNREEMAVLDSAARTLQGGPYRNLERSLLVAQLAELQAQHASEEARLIHHTGSLNQRLAAVAELGGGSIEVSNYGDVGEQMRLIVEDLLFKTGQAREALARFDSQGGQS